ncbi:LysR substrate-binding domain-containing protein [Sphingomonas zeicaulis]|uniref:LysR substrate-binding domain-containing protein n=1 Tax=Sphingomonas zeicaulis TaxID=1632740 RepID=UPI003D1E381E
MSEGFGRLPLRSLAVFEAAARHGKFSAAAEELLMTQAGVSQHISQLEADLGVSLFDRRHRGVALTSAGEVFRQSVGQGLRTLSDGITSVRRLGGSSTIRILTDFGFAAWWLMPRIAALIELMPEVEIRLVTAQSIVEAREDEFDIGILFGKAEWRNCRSTPLFPERIYPVCAPSYLGARSVPMAPDDIAGLRLLHLRSGGPDRWFDWDGWFEGVGAKPPPKHHEVTFSNYQILLQAVLLGQGVGIGWTPLIDAFVADGSLVRLTDQPLASERGYHIVQPAGDGRNDVVERIAAWLLDEQGIGRRGVDIQAGRYS